MIRKKKPFRFVIKIKWSHFIHVSPSYFTNLHFVAKDTVMNKKKSNSINLYIYRVYLYKCACGLVCLYMHVCEENFNDDPLTHSWWSPLCVAVKVLTFLFSVKSVFEPRKKSKDFGCCFSRQADPFYLEKNLGIIS